MTEHERRISRGGAKHIRLEKARVRQSLDFSRPQDQVFDDVKELIRFKIPDFDSRYSEETNRKLISGAFDVFMRFKTETLSEQQRKNIITDFRSEHQDEVRLANSDIVGLIREIVLG